MTPMAELEIDDVAFLAGDSRGHNIHCETCHCICRGSSGGSSATRRRFSGPRGSHVGLSALLNSICPKTIGSSRGAVVTATILTSLLILLLLIALFFLIFHPFSSYCLDAEAAARSSSSPTSDSSSSSSTSSNTNHKEPLLATNGEKFPWPEIRLPTFIEPVHYDLFMHPNLTTFTTKGWVDILLTVHSPVDFLVLHSKDMNISEVSLSSMADEFIVIKRHLLCISSEQLYIELDRVIQPSLKNYTLRLGFSKKLEEKLEGFYISSYNDSSSDRKRYLATTHFEPTAARSAFPCFDEPALKATFTLKMVHEMHYEVYFNSDRQTKIVYNPEGLVMSVFDETVRMSTYLVAFTVCDFKAMSARTKEGIHVRVLIPSDQYDQADYALYAATQILSYYQEFFNVTYPLSKLDLMAVPDFGAGAMENWGLITFRTTMILFNEAESSSDFQEQVATVISHELAHQWFGNLVTMAWWNDLWLNEGFASFIENLGVDFIHPEWKMLDQFVVSTTQDAMSLDSLESSHPIMANVVNPSEIEAIFDVISYKKGAALIRMLENFLKLDVLRAGLSRYLHKYQFLSAQTKDLWQCFTDVVPNSSVNVTAIMERWVRQKGFPVISSKLERNRLYLSQRRFLSAPSSDEDPLDVTVTESSDHVSPFGYQWIVPITVITNKSPDVQRLVWLSAPDAVLTMDASTQWFKLNVNQSGFYRVNYDDVNWRRLIEVLHSRDYNRHALSPSDRSNLLDDGLAFMKVSLLSADLAMNLTSYLETGERDYVPWETALKHFASLDAVMGGHPLFHKFLLKLLQPSLAVMGWKDDGTHLFRKLRASILKAAVLYGDEPTIKIAKRFFDEWLTNRYRVAPNFREVVYTTGVRFGSSKEWEFCWKKYKSSKIPSEQRLLLDALSSTRDPWLLQRLLNYSLEKDKIKPQDTVQVLTDISRNPDGRLIVWRFVRSNWGKILTTFGQGSFSMDSIISGITYHFSNDFDYHEVQSFFSKVNVGSGSEAVKQSLERIRANIYWKQYVESQVINWLQNQSYRTYRINN